jgi:hypothetical protein
LEFGSSEHQQLLALHNPHSPKRSYGTAAGRDLRPRDHRHHSNILDIEDLDAAIYRILPKNRLVSALQESRLTLTRVARWDDPFENWALRATLISDTGERIALSNIHSQYFGQCWTLKEESDAMWRIYSPNFEAVKIRTTVQKLFDSFYDYDDVVRDVSYFMGLVRYLPVEQIKVIMGNPDIVPHLIFDSSAQLTVRTLLTKRLEFSHEEEVRLIRYIGASNSELSNDYPSFNVDTNQVFDELVIDPRCSVEQAALIRKDIEMVGYRGPVRQSELYQFPTFESPLPKTPPFGKHAGDLWEQITGLAVDEN